MPSNMQEYIYNVSEGLKANKDYTKFRYRTQIGNKEYTKTINYTKKTWNLKDRKKYAISEALSFREQKEHDIFNPFSSDSTFDFIADAYFTTSCTVTDWNKERQRLYELHIKPYIGKKKISRVLEYDIDAIRTEMKKVSHAKYSEKKVGAVAKSLSDRTVEKVLLQVLKPILVYAHSNGAISRMPTIKTGSTTKASQRKKTVTDATSKVISLYVAIHKRYNDDPFYRAMFLFAFWGRRWNEIKTMKWESIRLDEHTATVEAENNKVGLVQVYYLSDDIVDALSKIPDEHKGLVFKSPVTHREMSSPRKQLKKIKEDTGVDDLTMHYFRHLFVTAGGEHGMANTIMSAALGHTRSDTVDKHYRTINHLKSSKDAVKQLEQLLPEVRGSDPSLL